MDSNPFQASPLENLGKGSRLQSSGPSSDSSSDCDVSSEFGAHSILDAGGGEKDAFVALLKKIPERRGVNTMEDLLLLSPPRMPAYGLKSKKWGWVLIGNLTPVSASDVPFVSLQVDQATKSLVRSLVAGHQRGVMGGEFDDVVETKGKGLVMMLHG